MLSLPIEGTPMEAPKPQWLSNLLDAAQIVSAVFTAGAVIVAVWLARRNESQRLIFFVGTRENTAIFPGRHTTFTTGMILTVVNAGILPVTLKRGAFHLSLKGSVWASGLGDGGPGVGPVNFPIVLQHGEQAVVYVAVDPCGHPWSEIRTGWWYWYRPKFELFTSLGKTYKVRPPLKLLWRLRRDWLQLTRRY